MSFPTGTIRLEAASGIFSDAEITAHKIGEEVVYYSATWRGLKLQNKSLTALCKELWTTATDDRTKADAAN